MAAPPRLKRSLQASRRRLRAEGHHLPAGPHPTVRLRARKSTAFSEVFHTLLHRHRGRTAVGLSLMAAQAFFYNAVFFTYALVLTDFYGVPANDIGWYVLP